MVAIPQTKLASSAPKGMVLIPGIKEYEFEVKGMVIEDYEGAGVQFPWENEPAIEHEHMMKISPFYMDRYLVSNDEFKVFLDASKYHPSDKGQFLKHWKNGSYAKTDGKRPVVWVSIEDARAYCAWAGKRLPNDWEWQYAAQGTDGRKFPWGNNWNPMYAPKPDTSRSPRAPDEVTAIQAPSPFGVQNLSNHIWQWTNEFYDQHNRRALVRGGSFYRPQGSGWYFPNTQEEQDMGPGHHPGQIAEHGNYLLMAPSLDRSGMIGFRCVMDAVESKAY